MSKQRLSTELVLHEESSYDVACVLMVYWARGSKGPKLNNMFNNMKSL